MILFSNICHFISWISCIFKSILNLLI